MKEQKRTADLLVDAVGWIESSLSSGSIAGLDQDTSDAEVVVQGEVRDDTELPDVAIGVAAIASSTSRENRRERKTYAVDAEVSVSNTWVSRHGVLGVTRIADAVADELTDHRDGWRALGESGGTDGPVPDQDRNRYLEVRRCDLERID